MKSRSFMLVVLVAACAATTEARAEDTSLGARTMHASAGAGIYGALTGSEGFGPSAVLQVYPGAWMGRFGVRLSARGLDGFDSLGAGLVAAGLMYEAAASRPRLALGLFAELGATWGDSPVASGPVLGVGVAVHLKLLGPVVLGVEPTAQVIENGVDTELALTVAATIRLAR